MCSIGPTPLYPRGVQFVAPMLFPRCGIAACLLLVVFGSSSLLSQNTSSYESMPIRIELYEAIGAEKKAAYKTTVGSSNPDTVTSTKNQPFNEGINNDDFVEPTEKLHLISVPENKIPDKVYLAPAFGFFRLPFKYDETGVRDLHEGPILFKATATLTLSQGQHRLVIRTRNDTKLFRDDELIAELKGNDGSNDGHNPLQNIPELVAPTIKEFAPGNAETIVTLISDGLPHNFVLETIVGHSKRRPDLGVLAVAIAKSNEDTFTLLGSSGSIIFSDDGWADYTDSEQARHAKLDAHERHLIALEEEKYWKQRHAYAKQWAKNQDPITIPQVGKQIPKNNAIDHFIGRRLEEVALQRMDESKALNKARSKGLVVFRKDIKPILEENCLKCHGDKEKGELRLDSRDDALFGGESDGPAFVPGNPEESLLIELVNSDDKEIYMPPKGNRLTQEEKDLLARWIKQGAPWEETTSDPIAATRYASKKDLKSTRLTPLSLTEDLAFLRRVTLDTVGQIPTVEEIRAFESSRSKNKRNEVIDRLLSDARWADHWVPFWQDILAENPNIVKPNLNNTGAFRWWIHESFLDNKPMDRFLTDLIRMRGNKYIGPAGFGMATQNDVPMAAKATILGGAFMGVQMRCARCHDAPFQDVKQEELFNIAAMLERKAIKVPSSSIVPTNKLSGHDSLVKVSLKPNEAVDPAWPFYHYSDSPLTESLIKDPEDPREILAAYMSSPTNTRFAKAMVNWTWKRYFGKGLVEPALDWENAEVSHPKLLEYLARELVIHGYDIKHLCRLILNSHTYQRTTLQESNPEGTALFIGQSRRRMTAEQILDSLHLATDREIDSEELNMDQDGRRPLYQFINLGKPRRAWEFTSLSNERDRPSLTLPHAQIYVDVLEAYGWNGSRQNPIEERDHETNVLQPAVLANGIMSQRLTRLTDTHPLTRLAMDARKVEDLVDILFLKTLGRHPDKHEQNTYTALLADNFEERVIPESKRSPAPEKIRYPYVSWSNHLVSEANEVKEAIARDIEAGEPPTRFLKSEWRKNLEDGLWALINSPEMIFIP